MGYLRIIFFRLGFQSLQLKCWTSKSSRWSRRSLRRRTFRSSSGLSRPTSARCRRRSRTCGPTRRRRDRRPSRSSSTLTLFIWATATWRSASWGYTAGSGGSVGREALPRHKRVLKYSRPIPQRFPNVWTRTRRSEADDQEPSPRRRTTDLLSRTSRDQLWSRGDCWPLRLAHFETKGIIPEKNDCLSQSDPFAIGEKRNSRGYSQEKRLS